jgi:hypothetical protein
MSSKELETYLDEDSEEEVDTQGHLSAAEIIDVIELFNDASYVEELASTLKYDANLMTRNKVDPYIIRELMITVAHVTQAAKSLDLLYKRLTGELVGPETTATESPFAVRWQGSTENING